MYEWLEQEIAAVATPKFFLTAANSGRGPSEQIELNQFPESYREFMATFGEAKFYRDSTGCYEIGISGKPERQLIDKESYWYIGWYDESNVLLKELSIGEEWPVYEESKYGRLQPAAEGFGEWLRMRWSAARAKYSDRKWKEILRGPEPFTPEEMEIVNARRQFRWRLLNIDDNCTMQFEVCNGSNRRLPYISIGVHGRRHDVWLGVVLEVDHIYPGQTAVIEYNKFPPGMLDPDEIEVFDEPDPDPEDREFYWEFQPLPGKPEGNGARRHNA